MQTVRTAGLFVGLISPRSSSIVFARKRMFKKSPKGLPFFATSHPPHPPCHRRPLFNLRPNEDVRHVRHAVLQLRDPFLLDVVVRGRIDDREADQKHIRVGVGERPQLVVVLLWEEQRGGTAWWGGSRLVPWNPDAGKIPQTPFLPLPRNPVLPYVTRNKGAIS